MSGSTGGISASETADAVQQARDAGKNNLALQDGVNQQYATNALKLSLNKNGWDIVFQVARNIRNS